MFQIALVVFIVFIAVVLIMKLKIVIIIEEEWYIDFYILKVIKIKRYKINEKEIKKVEQTTQEVAKEEVGNYLKQIEVTDAKMFICYLSQLFKRVKIDTLEFKININVEDYILNSYILTVINTVVAMLISKNIERINTDNLNYTITSNESETKLRLKCIMLGRFTNIIIVLIRAIRFAIELKKRGNGRNGKRTSNRKFNGDSDVISRINGRC